MPSQTFWTAEDKIPISQKKVSIQAENGLEYSLGQQIDFVIPESVGYMMPSETYLRMDVKLNSGLADAPGDALKLMLDAQTGCNVLIRDIRVSSGGAQNILLEELQNVNVLTSLKYDYECNDTLIKKRAMTEGVVVPTPPQNRGTLGCTSSSVNNQASNPYFSNNATFTNGDYKTVKALLRLPTGIFQNDKIFPLGLTGGLRVQIILEDANRVFRTLDNVKNTKNQRANPLFHSTNGSNTAPTLWSAGATRTAFWIQRANHVTSVATCPFSIGETCAFIKTENGSDTGSDCEFTITGIEYDISVGSGNGGGGLVKITCASATNNTGYDVDQTFSMYSRAPATLVNLSPTATVNNVELICQKVEMPEGYTRKMMSMLKAGGSMNYDFMSYTNYKYSQQQSDRVANIRLPLAESRAKSILCVPTDASTYTTANAIGGIGTYKYNELEDDCGAGCSNFSDRSGLVGIADHATNYQFIYDGKLNPNRKVPLSRTSVVGDYGPINQQGLIEQEKALHQAGIDPLSFESYQKNFFIGRALSLQNGIYDARGKDFNLQVEYNETTNPTKAKLWNCWCAHLRRIVVRGENIALEV